MPVGFLEAPAQRLLTVLEGQREEAKRRTGIGDDRAGQRVGAHVEGLVGNRRVAQAFEVGLTTCREVDVDGMLHLVEREAEQHAGKPEAVVAVEVRDADPRDRRPGGVGQDELALRALAGVEEEHFVVPTQQVPVVVAVARRRLPRGPQHDELARRHRRVLGDDRRHDRLDERRPRGGERAPELLGELLGGGRRGVAGTPMPRARATKSRSGRWRSSIALAFGPPASAPTRPSSMLSTAYERLLKRIVVTSRPSRAIVHNDWIV